MAHSPYQSNTRPVEPQVLTARCAAGRFGDTLVACVHGTEPLPDADNELLLAEVAALDVRRILVHVAGTAHPPPRQRGRIAEVLRKRGANVPRVALLCDSVMVRGVITALEWLLNAQVAKGFASSDLSGALAWLEHDDPATVSHAMRSFDATLRMHGTLGSKRRAAHMEQFGRGQR